MRQELEAALARRKSDEPALRIFHGPGEARTPELASLAIDRYGGHYWVTHWGEGNGIPAAVTEFLRALGAKSAVGLSRPERGVPAEPVVLLGEPPTGRYEVSEGKARFGIQLLGTRHPGLFLDHAPLRRWLEGGVAGRRVLNTFAYTGSLSIAAALGGASEVTTLDLSKPTIHWARENWERNALPVDAGTFICGDTFEWLPRLRREGKVYDCVILDPPSFSRGKRGNFSTTKDLVRLHRAALAVLAPGGILVTSINSANVPRGKYMADIEEAILGEKRRLDEVLHEIGQPASFPARNETEAYLKGWVLRVR